MSETEFIEQWENKFLDWMNISEDSVAPGDFTTDDPFFADDDFFHPDVIHDEETCKWILYGKIPLINVPVWDFLMLIPTVTFFIYIIFNMEKARQKLKDSPSVLNQLFFAGTCFSSAVSALRCLVSMFVHYEWPASDKAAKVIWILTKYALLATELSVLLLTSTRKGLSPKAVWNRILLSFAITTAFCILLGYAEFHVPYYGYLVIRSGYRLYGQGGPVMLATTSAIESAIYLVVFVLTCAPKKPLIVVSRPGALYAYLGGQFFLNFTSMLGSMLLLSNHHFGLCLTDITMYIYYALLAPVIFGLFIYPALRKNQPVLLMSYNAQDEDRFEAGLETFGSVETLTEPSSGIIKANVEADLPNFDSGLMSPDEFFSSNQSVSEAFRTTVQ